MWLCACDGVVSTVLEHFLHDWFQQHRPTLGRGHRIAIDIAIATDSSASGASGRRSIVIAGTVAVVEGTVVGTVRDRTTPSTPSTAQDHHRLDQVPPGGDCGRG